MKVKWMVLLLCGIVVFGCEKKDSEAQKEESKTLKNEVGKIENPAVAIPTKMGDRAYPLTGMEWVKGEPVTFEAGSVYVVEFWATWCPPCLKSIPHLTEVQHKYKDQKVTVIGISDEEVETVKSFVAQQGSKMDYTVAVDLEGKVNSGYMKAFNQDGIPHAFIVDGKGQIVWHGYPIGELDEALADVVGGN